MGGPGPQGRSRSCPRALGRGRRLRGVQGDGGSSRPGTGTRRQRRPRGQEEALQPQAGGVRGGGAAGRSGLWASCRVLLWGGGLGWGSRPGKRESGHAPREVATGGPGSGSQGGPSLLRTALPSGDCPSVLGPGWAFSLHIPTHRAFWGLSDGPTGTGAAWVTLRRSGQSRAGTGVHVPSLGHAGRCRGAGPDVARVASPDTEGAPIRSPSTPGRGQGHALPSPDALQAPSHLSPRGPGAAAPRGHLATLCVPFIPQGKCPAVTTSE